VIRLLFLAAIAWVAVAQTTPLPMRFANLPACAGPSATPRPAPDKDGNFHLMRIQDPAGGGIDIWCVKEASGYNYQYRLFGPGGTSIRLDRCQISDGINSAGVDHEGPVAEAPLPNGGQWLRTAGRLVKFQHHNWDSRRGHHAIYDFRRQYLTTYSSIAMQDAAGRWVRAFDAIYGYPLNAIPQSDPIAALGKTPPDRTFDPNRVGCITALADEGMRIHEEEVGAFVAPQQAGKLTIAWPESSPIESVNFDAARRELHVKFLPNTRKAIVSIAIPRTMLGLGKELSHVRLDNRFIESNETTTETHKSIRFRIDEPVKEALINESQGFPFFAVTGIALLGAVLFGGIIGILFRRKLPAVPEDPLDPRDATLR